MKQSYERGLFASGVIGINHRSADLKLRERLVELWQRQFGTGRYHQQCCLIPLSTCNRAEVYFSSHDIKTAQQKILETIRNDVGENIQKKFYCHLNHSCFHHLARVTAGLDSAIIGETEIQGQVKTTYEQAIAGGPLRYELHFMFQKCLKIGKQVRNQFHFNRDVPDIEHIIYDMGDHFFDDIKKSRVLFVGASDINRKIWSFLKAKGVQDIRLCNRSLETAKEQAKKYRLQAVNLTALVHWHKFDWIILATKCPHFLVQQQQKTQTPTLLIDLSVPRNVDPAIGICPGVSLFNIDQLNERLKEQRQQSSELIKLAELQIADKVKQQIEIFNQKTSMQGAFNG